MRFGSSETMFVGSEVTSRKSCGGITFYDDGGSIRSVTVGSF